MVCFDIYLLWNRWIFLHANKKHNLEQSNLRNRYQTKVKLEFANVRDNEQNMNTDCNRHQYKNIPLSKAFLTEHMQSTYSLPFCCLVVSWVYCSHWDVKFLPCANENFHVIMLSIPCIDSPVFQHPLPHKRPYILLCIFSIFR